MVVSCVSDFVFVASTSIIPDCDVETSGVTEVGVVGHSSKEADFDATTDGTQCVVVGDMASVFDSVLWASKGTCSLSLCSID